MSDLSTIRFVELRLVGPAKFYWDFITNARKKLHRKPIELWEEMKVKLKERYLLDFYMNRLVYDLHNPHKSRQIVSSNDVGESRIIENVSVLSKITSIVKNISIDSSFKIASVVEDTSIVSYVLSSSLDEVYVFLQRILLILVML